MGKAGMSVSGLQVGHPVTHRYKDQDLFTGIFKRPAQGRIRLDKLNFAGDSQADLEHHGGPDKAVCVYCAEHYPYWQRELKLDLPPAAFGENLTVTGLTEDDVCIGDVYQIGEAVVQVSQPRQPCHKLAKKYDIPELPLLVQSTGYTGYYFRVLQEGTVAAGDDIRLVQKHSRQITVSYANRIMHHGKRNAEGIRQLLELPELSESWRKTLTKRLEGIEVDSSARLDG